MKANIALIVVIFFSINCIQAQTSTFNKYKAFNGVAFEYTVLVPKDFDSNETYKTIVSFAGVDRKDDASNTSITTLWKNHKNYNSIIIIAKVPVGESDWISHPIHHGFNDFLKYIKTIYNVENQKFHFLGYKGGCVPAQTYVSMLEYPAASLTVLSSGYWDHYNEREYNRLAKLNIPINIIYLANEEDGIKKGQQVVSMLIAKEAKVTLKVCKNFVTELNTYLQ